ncbi:MAG: hypothetical protein IJJ45_11315 [Clostridia bacterium]|nr:hypothetical protein [Clostridia bacterium]
MGNEKAKKRFAFTGGDRIVLIVLAALAAVTVIINVLRAAGLTLIRGELYTLLPVGIVTIGVAWGLYKLVRLIRNRAARVAVGVLVTVIMMMAVLLLTSYLSLYVSVTTLQRYATVSTTDSAHKLVVMRTLDLDEARIEERRAARCAADPESSEEIVIEDYGYRYTAYAPTAGIFFRPDSLIEGEVFLGYASKAELMVDWEEDAAVGHFFIKDPQPGDSGEMRARTSGS